MGLLTKRHRGRIRSIAAEYWNEQLRYKAKAGDTELAKKLLASRIEARQEEIFGSFLVSILGPILVKLAITLAIKLLENWIEDQLFGGVEQGTTFRRNEP